jgi:hypothetical protein
MTIEPAVPTEGYTRENVVELIERVREVFIRRLDASQARPEQD